MNIVEIINDRFEELYTNIDARYGWCKQIIVGDEGLKVVSFDDSEPKVFVPDDLYNIQLAHILNTGSLDKSNPFNNSFICEVELVVISPKVKFYHVINVLNELGVQCNSFDLKTRSVLRNTLNVQDDYPETEAYIIKYQFTSKLNEFE